MRILPMPLRAFQPPSAREQDLLRYELVKAYMGFCQGSKFPVDKIPNCINVLIQMIIRVQPGLGTAIYLQIESQLKHAIAAGALKRDDALPPVRKLAAELRINPNTVARAYQNLERDGILRTVPGGGCYVNGQSPGLLKSEKLRRLKPLATQLAVEAKQLRLSQEDLVQLLENSYDELGEAP